MRADRPVSAREVSTLEALLHEDRHARRSGQCGDAGTVRDRLARGAGGGEGLLGAEGPIDARPRVIFGRFERSFRHTAPFSPAVRCGSIMTNRNPLIRPAMTAIAAAIACSTPSFAQSVDPAAAKTPAPAVANPVVAVPVVPDTPVAAETPAPVVADPVVADPVFPDTPVAAEPSAPAEAVAAPAARRATTTRTPPVRSRPAPGRTAPAAAPTPAASAPAAVSADPVAEAPVVEPLPIEPEAAPVAAPVDATDTSSDGMIIPLAAGGLALLALTGAALFLRRRKRHAVRAEDTALRNDQLAAIDDVEPGRGVEPRQDPVRPAVVVAPALATTVTPVVAAQSLATKAAPVAAAGPAAGSTPDGDGPVTELPEDFDLSRFGYNVQEAYKGPTENNPSLSMKNRLTRARGMDQLERNLDAEVEAATGEPVLTKAEMNPPAEASTAEAPAADRAVDAAKGDIPPSGSDQKPAMRPDVPN